MALTSYGTNHPMAVKAWRRRLFVEMLKETYVTRFMSPSKSSLCTTLDELKKGPGDKITCGLRMQLSGDGISGDETLEGNEEALTIYSDAVLIDQLRHAVRSKGKASEQRVPFSVRAEAKDGLVDWWAGRLDTIFFNQLAGNTGETDLRYTGANAALAPSTGRIIYGPLDATTENSLSGSESGSADFQLTMIDKAIATAETATPVFRKVRTPSGSRYVCFLHPYQVFNMRTDATANRVTWYDTQKARVSGGEMGNGIFSGALGEYNQTVMHSSTRVPLATGLTTVRRAIFCGAQAAAMAVGRDNSSYQTSWVEELFDYKNQLGVSGGMIFGMKKLQFNSVDFGTIILATHAEAP